MDVLLVLGIIAALFILGIRAGRRLAHAGHQIDTIIASHHRDIAVNDAADQATTAADEHLRLVR